MTCKSMGQQPVVAMMSAIIRRAERRGIVNADSYVNMEVEEAVGIPD